MNMTKDEKVSHATDIGSMMLKFLNKEGTGSFPTVTVLLNRIFLSPDDFSWKENGDFSDDLPSMKEHDDVHWYKILSGDLWNDNIKPSINQTVFPKTKLFIKYDEEKYSVIKRVFVSKNFVFEEHTDGKLYVCDIVGENPVEFCESSIASKILDHVYGLGCDFFLTSDTIYRSKNKGDLEAVYTTTSVLNSFCFCNNRITVASSKGGLVFNNIDTTFNHEGTIKSYYTSRIVTTPASEGGAEGGGGDGTTGSKTVYDTNHLPTNNNFTNVYALDDTHISLGDSSIAGKFVPGDSSTYEATDEVEDLYDTSKCPFIFLNPPRYHGGKGMGVLSGNKGFVYDRIHFTDTSITAVGAMNSDKITIFTLSDGKVVAYKNDEPGEKFLTLDSNNGVPSGIVNAFEIGDSIYLITEDGYMYRSVTQNDSENPICFVAFGFHYKEDVKKDTVDARQVRFSLMKLLILGCDRDTYNTELGKALSVNTTFVVAYSKTIDGRTVWNLYGNDTRKKEADELRDCCDTFDVGIPK